MRRPWFVLISLLLLAGYGAVLLIRSGPGESRHKDAPSLVFYTAVGATTPQLPLRAAIRDGWPRDMHLETRYWKDLDDLRGVMLAGRGDVWLGHVEGFAQAALHGAPVTLIAVTGWRKFRVLTTDPHVSSFRELARVLALRGEKLAVTPADSPAFALLDDLARKGGPRFHVVRQDPKQLALSVIRGDVSHMIAPEPLAAALRLKVPRLRDVAGLEEEYGRYSGGDGMLPLAGVAVRSGLLRERPEVVSELVWAMTAASPELREATSGNKGDVEAIIGLLPPETIRELGRETVRRSLEHDLVRVVPAHEAREDVLAYLSVVLPEASVPGRLPATFFGGK